MLSGELTNRQSQKNQLETVCLGFTSSGWREGLLYTPGSGSLWGLRNKTWTRDSSSPLK